jgi:hypothetical protein
MVLQREFMSMQSAREFVQSRGDAVERQGDAAQRLLQVMETSARP